MFTKVQRSGSNVWAAFRGSDRRGLPAARCRISAASAENAAALSEVLGLMAATRRMAETPEKGGSGPWSFTEVRKRAGGTLAANKVGGQLGGADRIFLKGRMKRGGWLGGWRWDSLRSEGDPGLLRTIFAARKGVGEGGCCWFGGGEGEDARRKKEKPRRLRDSYPEETHK